MSPELQQQIAIMQQQLAKAKELGFEFATEAREAQSKADQLAQMVNSRGQVIQELTDFLHTIKEEDEDAKALLNKFDLKPSEKEE